MIYKLIGSLVIFLGGGYVAASIGHFERRRLRVLDGYISLVYYIKGQIDCFARPIREILLGVDPAILAACLGVEHGAEHARLPEGGARLLLGLVDESRLYLAPESERLLVTFSSELGRSHRTEQVARCDYYIEALREERRRLGETLHTRVRLGSILCLCTAAGLAVLLW